MMQPTSTTQRLMNSGSKDVKQFCLKPFGQISNYYFIHCPMKHFAMDISIIRLLVYPACLPAYNTNLHPHRLSTTNNGATCPPKNTRGTGHKK